MKKLWAKSVLAAAVVLFCSASLLAQEQRGSSGRLVPRFGIKGGLNLTNMFVDDISDENMKVGWHAGVTAKLPVFTGFSIQPELMYSNKGAKQNYDNFIAGEGEYRFNLHYIEMPVLAVVNIGRYFNIHAGPYIAYLVDVNIKDLDDDGTITEIADLDAEDFNRFDWGVAAGIGVDIKSFTIGARYSYGFQEIGDDGNFSGAVTKDSRNSAIQFYIGFGF
jgi:hypothetical protein